LIIQDFFSGGIFCAVIIMTDDGVYRKHRLFYLNLEATKPSPVATELK
jgi:hypothetical protein